MRRRLARLSAIANLAESMPSDYLKVLVGRVDFGVKAE